MFFFPGGDRLHQDLIHEQERRADDQVLKWRPGLRDSLRGTLHHLALQEGPFLEEATSSSMALGVLGQEAWSVKQRISVLQGKQEDSPDYVLYLRWCLPGIGLLFLMILGETGPCTLHCVLAALP
jgi:hypothetical protein